MPYLLPSAIASLACTFVLAFVYLYLFTQDRQKFLLVWTAGWLVYALRFCFMLGMLLSGETPLLNAAYHLSALASGVLLLWGTHLFLGRALPKAWLAGAAAIGAWTVIAIMMGAPFWGFALPNFFFLGVIYIWTGSAFLRAYQGTGGRIVGWAFVFWGLHKADYPFLRQVAWAAPWGYIVSSVIELSVAIGMLLVYFERMKKELIEKEKRFRLFAENAQDIIFRFRLSPGRAFEYVSPSVTAIMGYTPEEHYADPDLAISMVHPDDAALLRNAIKDPARHGSFIVRWVRKDGNVVWTEQRNVPVLDDKGNLVAIEGIARNITDQKRSEEALREQEKRFREFLENMHLSAVMLDIEGRVTFCNDYFLNLAGWSRDEVIGKNWFEMFVPLDQKARTSRYFSRLMTGADVPLHQEDTVLTRKGEQRIVVWDSTVLRGSDRKTIGAAAIGLDVTDHRKLEEQLRQSQKMEAVGQLAGGVAHDFNNILTAIIGYAHLLKMQMKNDPLAVNVQQILESSERAATLTHSLLAFSRRQAISKRPIDLNDVITKTGKLLLRVIREDIEMRTELTAERLVALADRGQIEQVLMNLAANARDAMPRGGCLTVRTRRSMIDETFIESRGYGKPGAYAVIAVIDTGSGMDESTRKKIFEPFFTTKEVGKGTGLGLAMAYGIVKQHDGFIDVRSEPGKGTTFTIYLPLTDLPVEETARKTISSAEPIPRGSGTVLIAEDDQDIRSLSSLVLRESGYTVIEAADGEEAVRKFADHREDIRIVILDAVMPKKNGKDAFDEIRIMRPAVRALFVTGYAPDMVTSKSVPQGAEILLKPVSPTDLLKKVNAMLEGAIPGTP